jgi:hypothetical protein
MNVTCGFLNFYFGNATDKLSWITGPDTWILMHFIPGSRIDDPLNY